MLKPTVCRMVHFYDRDWRDREKKGPLAAMITGVSEDEDSTGVHLRVFPPGEEPYNVFTFYSEVPTPYTSRWCWPPRS